eukprot:symbB.v1.2.002024.t1/scaffold104.1/size473687/2
MSLGNAACWRGGFSFKTCCAGGGNPECFDALYTYEVCCLNAPSTATTLPRDCRGDDDVVPLKARCEGVRGGVSKDDWDHFFLSHQLSQTLGSSYKGWPDLPALLKKANASAKILEASEEDCAFGLVALIFQSLPAIERSLGSVAARSAYIFANRVLGRAVGSEDCRWTDMINHAVFFPHDMLLGKDPRFHFKCPAGAPRIYVYDTEMWTDTPLSCSRSSFWASEVYVDRFLQYSKCRTFEPENADLFFIPAYLTCWELQAKTPAARQQRLQRAADAIEHLPYKDDREGLDHIALFGASAWQLPGWRQSLQKSIILAVESEPIESDGIPESESLCSWAFP